MKHKISRNNSKTHQNDIKLAINCLLAFILAIVFTLLIKPTFTTQESKAIYHMNSEQSGEING